MESKENVRLVEFNCVEKLVPKDTRADPRPSALLRQATPVPADNQSLFQCFDCEAVDLPPETKAEPRPQTKNAENTEM